MKRIVFQAEETIAIGIENGSGNSFFSALCGFLVCPAQLKKFDDGFVEAERSGGLQDHVCGDAGAPFQVSDSRAQVYRAIFSCVDFDYFADSGVLKNLRGDSCERPESGVNNQNEGF